MKAQKRYPILLFLGLFLAIQQSAEAEITLVRGAFGNSNATSSGGTLSLDGMVGVILTGKTGDMQAGFWPAAVQSTAVQPPAPSENTQPQVASALANQNLTTGGAAFTRDLNTSPKVFSDADGDALTYSTTSSDGGVATASISGNTLTVVPVAVGSATITTTADDGKGGSVSTTFTVTVTVPAPGNTAPVVANTLPNQSVTVGGAAFTRDLNADPKVFSDADGDALIYSATSSDAGVSSASMSGSSLTVTPVAPGSVTITATADDAKGGSVSTTFTVAVTIPAVGNNPPQAATTLADQNLIARQAAFTHDLRDAFTDSDGDALTYTATSSNEAVATAVIFGTALNVTPIADGSATITVTADDGKGGTVSTTFTAAVTASAPGNRPPQVTSSISDQTVDLGDTPFGTDLTSVFADPDGDVLTYTVLSSNSEVATAIISGSTLRVTPQDIGSATITVTASDSKNATAETAFTFAVANRPPVAQNDQADTDEGGLNIDVLQNDNDPDGHALTVIEVASGQNSKRVVINDNGTVNYRPNPGFSGTDTFTYTADDGHGGTDTATVTVEVRGSAKPPVADFNFTPSSGESPLAVTFTDASTSNPTSWFWAFGDGSTSSEQNSSHSFLRPGTFTISLTVSNEGGSDTKTSSITVDVPAPPPAGVELVEYFIDTDPGYGAGTPIALDANGEALFGIDSRAIGPGFHTLFVRSKNATGNWGFVRLNRFYIFPEGTRDRAPVVSLEYFYNGADPGFGKAKAISISPAQKVVDLETSVSTTGLDLGEHNITLRAKDQNNLWGAAQTAMFTINQTGPNAAPVIANPLFDVELALGKDPFTRDLSADPPVFTDPEGTAIAYTVESSSPSVAGATMSGSTLTVIAVSEGTATITLAASDGQSATTHSFTITVVKPPEPPVANFDTDPNSGVEPLSVFFTDGSTNTPTEWIWEFGDGNTSTEQNPTHTYTTPGTYTVMLTVKNAGGSDSKTKEELISVIKQPIGEGPIGLVALDLDLSAGDQQQREDASPGTGKNVIIQIVAISGVQGSVGFQLVLQYDPAVLEWSGFQAQDIFASAALIPSAPVDGTVTVNAAILGGTASKDTGIIGLATFKVIGDIPEETRIKIISASYDTPVAVGSGGAIVAIGGAPALPDPDFDDDGSVGFTDFILFAGAFGSQDATFDLNGDGQVGFPDFLAFAIAFGKPI